MNLLAEFFVPGDPIALKRHRTVKVGNFNRQYDPSSNDKADFLAKAMRHKPEIPYSEPLSVRMTFLFSRPKAHYGSGKNATLLKPSAPFWHTSTPDSDNLAKFVGDALNGIFWKDDSCIARMQLEKKYTEGAAGVLVEVKRAIAP